MNALTRLLNHFRQEAQRANAHVTLPEFGIVTNYDPNKYAARVRLQPDDILTGWLPIGSIKVGNGFGIYAPPNLGDVVAVHFQQGGKEAGFIDCAFYNTTTKPLPVPSGEIWAVHGSGSLFKFTNNGEVLVSANTNMTLSAPNGTLRLAAQTIQVHASAEYRFDTNGHGQVWLPDRVNTYQVGEVAGSSNPISPPEIGD